jgi:hypothetical protein
MSNVTKKVFEITHEIMQKLMDNENCRIGQVSIVPESDSYVTGNNKTVVTIKFSYYDEPKKVKHGNKRDLKWHVCSEDCKGELNLAAFESDYQEGERETK